jgi:hypothetical protein
MWIFSLQFDGYQETVAWSLTPYCLVDVHCTCLSDYTASHISRIRKHMVQTFLWKYNVVVDIYKNGVESERARGPLFTQCGMGFVPFVCRFKADPTSSLILRKFSSLLDAKWMDGKNKPDVCVCVCVWMTSELVMSGSADFACVSV